MRPDLGNKGKGYNTARLPEAAEMKNSASGAGWISVTIAEKFAAFAPSRSSEAWFSLLKGPRFRASVGK
jgi:hypothetical protein